MRSTPMASVIWDMGSPLQAPCGSTVTTPSSDTSQLHVAAVGLQARADQLQHRGLPSDFSTMSHSYREGFLISASIPKHRGR